MNTTLISFYSDTEASNYYTNKAQVLQSQCKKFNIPCIIEEVPSLGSWIANTKYKATFILDKLEQHKDRLLWLDVDNNIVAPLDICDTLNCDVAAARYKKEGDFLKGFHVRIGTLFFNYTKPAILFLKKWKAYCAKSNEDESKGKVPSAHPLFSKVWREARDTGFAVIEPLPWTYSSNFLKEDTYIHVGLANTKSKINWKNKKIQGRV